MNAEKNPVPLSLRRRVRGQYGGRPGRQDGWHVPGWVTLPCHSRNISRVKWENVFSTHGKHTMGDFKSYPRSPLKLEWLREGYSLLLLLSTFWTHQRERLCLVLWVSNTSPPPLANLLLIKGAGLRPTPCSRLELHIIVFFPACLFSQFPSTYGRGSWGFHWQYSYKFPL